MTLKEFYLKYKKDINHAIKSALIEDSAYNDVTTNLLFKDKPGGGRISATLVCKGNCIIAGVDIFKKVYRKIDRNVYFKSFFNDGDKVGNKAQVLLVKSSLRNLLIGERTALNFLQSMSGIATLTSKFVRKLKFKSAKILHTRKTTPNFRIFELAAVKTGGGDFHRLSLKSAIMIKDNHIKSIGSLNDVFDELNSRSASKRLKHKLEIEVKNLDEVQMVVNRGKNLVDVVMLDNFKPSDVNNAVKMLKNSGFKIELSGGINLKNFSKIQRKGIDYYSIGMLTHSYKSIDFSLEF
ncbi:MAG: carboxylating nicotinate-nucleotide diphosphorylase [Chlorobi bacterium]|nr:carboxylating nicotinate-nucleotide diphosphorylase [Chlorobiota bacterium]MCI0715024.1 carboxylating nicotinate-nucleotide diphosphorylase [Chlorobiota bacterium]